MDSEQINLLFHGVSDLVIYVSDDLYVNAMNYSAERFYGCKAARVVAKSATAFFDKYHDVAPDFTNILKRLLKKDHTSFSNHTKDGNYSVNWTITRVKTDKKHRAGILFVGNYSFFDMECLDYVPLLRAMLNQAPVAMFLKDTENTYLACNEKMAEFANLNSRDKIIGKTDRNLPWAKKTAVIDLNYAKVLKTKEVCTFSVEKLPIGSSDMRTMHIMLVPSYNHLGSVIGVLGVFVDITDHESYRQTMLAKTTNEYVQKAAKAMSESMAKTIQKITGQTIGKGRSVEEHIFAISNYYESIIACMPNNVYWLDRNCVTLGCNDNVAKLVNLQSRANFPGITYEEMGKLAGWTEGQAESFKKDDMEVMATDRPKLNVEEPALYDEQGNPVYYISSRVPLHNIDGKVVGVVGISVDITKIKKQELALKRANEQAEVANDAKNRFIANMEHDLRTPCSGISEMTRILEEQETSPQKKEVLNDIYRAASQLLEILNGVLAFDHIESKMLPVLHKKFDMRKILNSVVAMETPYTKHKELEIISECTQHVPELLLGDEHRISRILINLVSNAVKFTKKGYVKIHVDLAAQPQGKKVILKLIVKDTGIGIPRDKQHAIYERFSRVHDANQGSYKGSGLGLSIVRQFIEELNGEIEVTSDIGCGSIFECLIPCELPLLFMQAQSSLAMDRTDADIAANVVFKILLVEDDALAQRVVTTILQQHFTNTCDVAPTGKAALTFAKCNKYDLILMDIGLPDISGYEVTKKIRNSKASKNKATIIIALTAHDSKIAQKNSIEAGMNDFLAKPLDKDKMQKLTKKWFKPKAKSAEVKTKIDTIVQAADRPQFKAIDFEYGKKFVSGNADLAMELLDIFMRELPDEMSAIDKAVQAKQWDMIASIAHKLRGATSYCGVLLLHNTAKDLEIAATSKNLKKVKAAYAKFIDEALAVQTEYAQLSG